MGGELSAWNETDNRLDRWPNFVPKGQPLGGEIHGIPTVPPARDDHPREPEDGGDAGGRTVFAALEPRADQLVVVGLDPRPASREPFEEKGLDAAVLHGVDHGEDLGPRKVGPLEEPTQSRDGGMGALVHQETPVEVARFGTEPVGIHGDDPGGGIERPAPLLELLDHDDVAAACEEACGLTELLEQVPDTPSGLRVHDSPPRGSPAAVAMERAAFWSTDMSRSK